MKEIINFKLKDFLIQEPKLISEYIVALQYLKPVETKRQVFHLKLKHVDFIKKNLYSNEDSELIKIVGIVQKIKVSEVFKMPIVEFFGIVASVKKQLDVINRAEDNTLSPTSINFKWEAVNGSERMEIFGIFNTLRNLSGNDVTKYKAIMNTSYSDIFTTLRMNKESEELQKEMDAIKTTK